MSVYFIEDYISTKNAINDTLKVIQ